MATPIATPAMNTDTQLAWVQAFQETQRQTAEAHAAYQRAMADSHMAFLRTAEVSFAGLSALLGASPAAVLNPASAPAAPVSGEPAQSVVAAPAVASVSALAAPAANAPQRPITQHQAPQVLVPPTPSVAAPIPTLALTQAVPSAVDLDSLMMGIVAEKTGYPPEMLNPAMELEADLGIDSIKRVEILAALRERAPHLPEIKASDLALLRTLGQIIGHLRSTLDSFANAASAGSQAATATIVGQPTPNAGDPALDALLLGVVAEKTGYPPQMLNLDMELEADLGIDSIKRVEILSSLRERAPALPELKASDLAVLRTLGQIVRHLQAAAGVSAIHQAASPPGGTTALASGLLNVPAKRNEPDTPDLATLLLDIVAEKTGYPQGMLNLQMALEADLGIDSIKRVEILAALRERAPNLPELKATDLAVLRTLGQIVEHMTTAVTPASLVEKTPAPVAPATSARIERYALREAATPASGQPMPGLRTAKRLVLTDDATGVADALQVLLAQQGIKANTVATIPADADGVIFLGGLRKVATVEDALAVNREAFHAARAVAALMAVHGGVFVTVQDTGGDFGLSGACAPQRAYLGGVSALTRTAALEWPQAAVKAIDIARGNPRTKKAADAQTTAVAIAHELLHGGDSLEVGLHADGRRTTLVAEASASPLVAVGNISADSVLVASGGARGVTAAALIALAKAKQPRMVLLGRSELSDEADELHGVVDEVALKSVLLKRAQVAGQSPTPAMLNAALADVLAQREIRSTLAALKAAGSEARYLALDVTDEAALTRALKDVRKQWGPITAVVHGAGVLADKRIEDKSDAQFDRVFDTKVKGLRALLAATAKDPLSALCLFSSVAARSGNPGQCDYAMANEVLNLVACAERTRRGEACVVRSIGWGPWEGGMVTPSLKTHFEQMGVPLLPLEVGARHFVAEITGRSDEVSIVIGGTQRGGILQANTEPRATIASAGHRPNAEAAALA